MEAFAQRARTCVLYPIDRAKPHICLIVQFFRTWMSLRAPSRNHWEPVRGSQLNMVCVSMNCFCFCYPSEEWKGSPQLEVASIAPIFCVFWVPFSCLSSKLHTWQAGGIDGWRGYIFCFGNQWAPSTLCSSFSVLSPTSMAMHIWSCFFLFFLI